MLSGPPSPSHILSAASRVLTAWSLLQRAVSLRDSKRISPPGQCRRWVGSPEPQGTLHRTVFCWGRRPQVGLEGAPQRAECKEESLCPGRWAHSPLGEGRLSAVLGWESGWWLQTAEGLTGHIPGLGRTPGEGKGYPLQYSWASLVAQLVKNLPAMQETWVRFLGREDPL